MKLHLKKTSKLRWMVFKGNRLVAHLQKLKHANWILLFAESEEIMTNTHCRSSDQAISSLSFYIADNPGIVDK